MVWLISDPKEKKLFFLAGIPHHRENIYKAQNKINQQFLTNNVWAKCKTVNVCLFFAPDYSPVYLHMETIKHVSILTMEGVPSHTHYGRCTFSYSLWKVYILILTMEGVPSHHSLWKVYLLIEGLVIVLAKYKTTNHIFNDKASHHKICLIMKLYGLFLLFL